MTSAREKVNILMVDDMPAKLLSYEAILGDLDENLIKATSAREALEQLLKKEIAVVLMDVSMPEVDGFELAAMIHEHPRHGETAIIFVSGVHLSDIDRVKAYQRGAVDYISVPIIPEILRAKVSVFVELYRRRQQLEQVKLELEQRVAERTVELQKRNEELQKLNTDLLNSEESLQETQRNLRKALSAAEQASRLKDEFLATVSHELRTPLNAILGWAHLLQSSSLDPSVYSSGLAAITSSAKNQVQIINDLLDSERIVNGKMTLQPQTVSLADLLSTTLNTLAHAVSAKNIGVFFTFSEDARRLFVYVDQQRLQQVFWNILSNAVKFSPSGGKVEVRMEKDQSEAIVTFQDWGKGIRPEFLPFVFERFRQEDSSTTRRFGGLGLGLSIAKHFIEMHGGTITAESEGEGKGSRITVRLPSTLFRDAREQQPIEARSAPPEVPFPNVVNARILLVDDDIHTLDVLRQAFMNAGAEIKVCESSVVALRLLDRWQPDLLISDLAMPEHDGYWLIRQIRSSQSILKEIPAIALTAHASRADQDAALAAGFHLFVAKPAEPQKILTVVNGLIERSRNEMKTVLTEPHISTKSAELAGKKILLVEDDPLFTKMLEIAFRAQGLNLRSAGTASEGFRIATDWLPDAIISDLGLPDEDGFSFIGKIRALPSSDRSTVPALALSGYGKEEGNRALAAGFQAYKIKPVDPATLITFLEELFKSPPVHQE